MKLIGLIILLTGVGFAANDDFAKGCFSYEPATVSLTGKISRRTFAGRPNYESVKKGDEPETYWILHPVRPFCVNGESPENDSSNVPEKNVSKVQLVLTSAQYARYKKMIGKRVVVTGTFFHANTGHHHTSILFTVAKIKCPKR